MRIIEQFGSAIMTGFQSPNYTQAPNDFFSMFSEMSDAELRVTGIMIRYTFGFHRDGFKMGVNKLAKAAGLSRQGALDGAKAAEERGTFKRTNPEEQTEAEWELVVPLNSVEAPLQPVEESPLASRGQVGVKESIKKELNKDDYNLLFKGDFREYPEHLWEVAQALQNEWGFAMPAKPQKKQSKGEYAFYIMAMDDIKTAAGEFNASNILTDVRREFVDYMEKHGGLAPFTVGKPSALITSVSAKAREMRMKKPEKPRTPTPQPDYSDAIPNPGRKPLIPRGIG